MAMQEEHTMDIALTAIITVWPSTGNMAILLQEHLLGHVGLECLHHR